MESFSSNQWITTPSSPFTNNGTNPGSSIFESIFDSVIRPIPISVNTFTSRSGLGLTEKWVTTISHRIQDDTRTDYSEDIDNKLVLSSAFSRALENSYISNFSFPSDKNNSIPGNLTQPPSNEIGEGTIPEKIVENAPIPGNPTQPPSNEIGEGINPEKLVDFLSAKSESGLASESIGAQFSEDQNDNDSDINIQHNESSIQSEGEEPYTTEFVAQDNSLSQGTNNSLNRVLNSRDNAGNTLGTARNIGALSSTQTFSDFVGTSDTNDYYRFSLRQASRFNLTLNGLSADADIQLLSSTGLLLQGSYRGGNLAETINRDLSAGTYFVRVFPYRGNTNYNLTVSATASSPPPIDNAGNTLATARNIGTLTTSRTFSDFVGSIDTNDYYRFDLSQSSNFNLTLNGLSSDADVQLLSSSGGVLRSGVNGGNIAESLSASLNAGTYFVRVFPFSGNTNYNLTVSATASSPPPSIGYSATYGYGLINAAAAVARSLGQTIAFPDVPNLGGNNWGNDLVKAPEVWTRGYTGQGIVVAVVDTGVDYTHPDLDANIWVNSREIAGNGIDDDGNGFIDDIRGWDFVNNDNNPLDRNGHGTHVAGTIAGENNGFGVTGVAYNSRIMAVQVLSDTGSGSYTGVANGIRYAANNGAHVINLSLGGGYSGDVYSAVQYASNRGSIVVMAAGNSGASQPGYPAFHATEFGLSIGAVDNRSTIASFSNRAGSTSAMRHVVAPGVSVYSSVPNNGYASYSGTSMAAPHASGVVALMRSANIALTHAQVRDIVTGTASSLS